MKLAKEVNCMMEYRNLTFGGKPNVNIYIYIYNMLIYNAIYLI